MFEALVIADIGIFIGRAIGFIAGIIFIFVIGASLKNGMGNKNANGQGGSAGSGDDGYSGRSGYGVSSLPGRIVVNGVPAYRTSSNDSFAQYRTDDGRQVTINTVFSVGTNGADTDAGHIDF